MNSAENIFRGYLKSKGLRFTPERKKILEEIMRIDRHFEVEELIERLRKCQVAVSRASIYRTLSLLINSGLVDKTTFDAAAPCYEIVRGHHDHHDHMVCVKCGRLIEFKHAEIERLQEEVAKEHGFKMRGHRLTIYGVCRNCR